MRRAGLLIVGAAATVAIVLQGAGAVTLTPVTCGMTVNVSITVGNDLSNCTGAGLVVGASKITINLNGHTIDGDESGSGNGIAATDRSGVTVQNGTISGFDTGISFAGAAPTSPNKVTAVTVRDNNTDGVGGHLNSITSSYAIHNGHDGFMTTAGQTTMISKVTTRTTGTAGIVINGDKGTVDSSVVSDDAGDGIVLNGAGAKVTNNIVTAGSVAIHAFGASPTITGNAIGSGGNGGIYTATSATVTKNVIGRVGDYGIYLNDGVKAVVSNNTVVSALSADGIFVAGNGPATISGNAINSAGLMGINMAVDSSTVSGNTVGRSGDTGIYVGGDAVKITGNTVLFAGNRGIDIAAVTGDTVQGNIVDGSADSAIHVAGDHTMIASNTARGSSSYGIEDAGTSNTLKLNTAVANDSGISTTGIDGGGNKAAGNRIDPQCSGVVCKTP
jgi:large repetitive protein